MVENGRRGTVVLLARCLASVAFARLCNFVSHADAESRVQPCLPLALGLFNFDQDNTNTNFFSSTPLLAIPASYRLTTDCFSTIYMVLSHTPAALGS